MRDTSRICEEEPPHDQRKRKRQQKAFSQVQGRKKTAGYYVWDSSEAGKYKGGKEIYDDGETCRRRMGTPTQVDPNKIEGRKKNLPSNSELQKKGQNTETAKKKTRRAGYGSAAKRSSRQDYLGEDTGRTGGEEKKVCRAFEPGQNEK